MKTMAPKQAQRDDEVAPVAAACLPKAPPMSKPDGAVSTHGIVLATHHLQAWLHRLEQDGLAQARSTERVITISEAVAARFCIGVMDNRTFFGVQDDELRWFSGLPWFHVALMRGSSRLNFVCEQAAVDGLTLPAFALAFMTQSPERISELTRYRRLDVRRIEVDAAGRVTSVGRALVTTVDIHLVHDDSTMAGLMAGRFMTGHTNRSVIRSAKK